MTETDAMSGTIVLRLYYYNNSQQQNVVLA